RVYRGLVWEDEALPRFFRHFTPIDELALLEIGSRPVARPGGARGGGREARRAGPRGFAWAQNPQLPPPPYGAGRALSALDAGARRELYRTWPFLAMLVDNLEMTLAKTSLEIAAQYLSLVPAAAEPERIFGLVEAEHARTLDAVLETLESPQLLDRQPLLQRSVQLRNPYVDPLNAIQVELLRRHRGGEEEALRPLLRSITGIAAALRNTG